MKNSELKKLINDLYMLTPSEKQKSFVKKYRKRELKFSELLFIQLKYMKVQYSVIIISLLCFIAFALLSNDESMFLMLSSFMPFLVVPALSGFGKSERFNMNELEMSSTLSLRMIKAMRLFLLAFAGMASIGAVFLVFKVFFAYSLPFALLVSGFPYTLTTAASMILIRRWHAKENIYGCMLIAAVISVLTIIAFSIGTILNEIICHILFIATILVIAREIYLYINEREELQWNLY